MELNLGSYLEDGEFLNIKDIYFEKINSKEYSRVQKENISFFVWFCVHELFRIDFLEDDFLYYLFNDLRSIQLFTNILGDITKPIYDQLYNDEDFELFKYELTGHKILDKKEIRYFNSLDDTKFPAGAQEKQLLFCVANGYCLFNEKI